MPVMQMPDWSAKPEQRQDNFRLKCVGQREMCWPRKGNSSGGEKKKKHEGYLGPTLNEEY